MNAFDEVLAVRGKPAPAISEVSITGQDPVLSSRFRIGETCAAVLGGVVSGMARTVGRTPAK